MDAGGQVVAGRWNEICRGLSAALGLCALIAVSACAPAPRASEISDPFETANRATHDLNKSIDRTLLQPTAKAYSGVARGPVGTGIHNFTGNLALPGMVLNDLLQLKFDEAIVNTARFALNSTFGLAGLLDVAGQNGIYEKSTDFGETLHVWGFSEGHYIELPFFGPSTGRDAAGLVVDFLIDPVNNGAPLARRYVTFGAKLVDKVGDRSRYGDLVDSILYGSEDSYAQGRLLYLQSRRRDLYGGLSELDLEDPYAE
jgi:phospholipid-binding lipoprotein MlaA